MSFPINIHSPCHRTQSQKARKKEPAERAAFRIAPGGESSQRATLDGSQDGRRQSYFFSQRRQNRLTGRTVLLAGDDAAEYERHLAAYAEEFVPIGYQESHLVQSIADTGWRLRRIPVLEMALFAKGRLEFAELFEEQEPAARPHLIDAHTFITYEKQIRNLHLQEARLSRRREKEITELRRLQAERIRKQQDPKPTTDGFVFSTREIEPPALPAILMTSPPHAATAANFS